MHVIILEDKSKLSFFFLTGSLQLRYNLGGLLEPFTVDLDQRNLANGQPHSVNITRIEREIQIQVRILFGLYTCVFVFLLEYMNKLV